MLQRQRVLEQLESRVHDVLIIGGGINGAAAAAAASGGGAQVALVDSKDVGSQTSANSSNLIWGGIKYLENGDVRLVNELCRCRNQLLQKYPSRIREMRFLATIPTGFRKPPWMVYAGAWLYWLFGRGQTQMPLLMGRQTLTANETMVNADHARGAVEYSDAWLVDNDARFTFDFIKSAMRRRALVANYTRAEQSWYQDGLWHTRICDQLASGQSNKSASRIVRSRALVNATGPWVDGYHRHSQQVSQHHHVFSKGIHLVVPKITEAERVLAFFASDGRLFFVIPMGNRTCIGTTDTRVDSPEAVVTDEDRQFVLDNVNQRLKLSTPLQASDVLSERCGVRPLAASGGTALLSGGAASSREAGNVQTMSRRHIIETDPHSKRLSIFGGKLTDCINVGNEVCDQLKAFGLAMHHNPDWFGEADEKQRQAFYQTAADAGLNDWCECLNEPLTQRWWRRYGMDAFVLLERVQQQPELLGKVFPSVESGPEQATLDDIRLVELVYARDHEMVATLEDFVRRRTMMELTIGKQTLLTSDGLRVIAEQLFGSDAGAQLQAYAQGHSVTSAADSRAPCS